MPYETYNIIKHDFWSNSIDKYIEWNDGLKCWYDENGRLHRIDGPAIILSNGEMKYYLHGILYRDINSNDEWMIKMLLE
jgi:hypothetical protein